MRLFGKKMPKGQASIELILLLAVVLLLVQTIILPSFTVGEKAVNDVSSLAIARSQAQKLANAVELVESSSAGAIQTVSVLVPAHSEVGCYNDLIFYRLKPSAAVPESCLHDTQTGGGNEDNSCSGTIAVSLAQAAFLCDGRGVLSRLDDEKPMIYRIAVSKNSSGKVSLNWGD